MVKEAEEVKGIEGWICNHAAGGFAPPEEGFLLGGAYASGCVTGQTLQTFLLALPRSVRKKKKKADRGDVSVCPKHMRLLHHGT